MKKKALAAKIAASKREIVDAEQRLTKALRETRSGPRAEKTTITEVVKEALSSLRKARADLEALEELVRE